MSLTSYLLTYAAAYYTFMFFAVFGFFSFIYCLVKTIWKFLNFFSGKKKEDSSVDEAQNRKIKQLEAEVKSLRHMEKDLDSIRKQINNK